MSKLMGRWIYDGDCLITSCCNIAYDIDKFKREDKLIYVPCICPKCGIRLFPPDTNALELIGMAGEHNDD